MGTLCHIRICLTGILNSCEELFPVLFVLFVVVRPIKLIEFTTVSPWLTHDQNWIYDFNLTHTLILQ